MHPGLTLEKRIAAEIASYDGKMAVYVNDLKGNIIEINVDEQFKERDKTIKTLTENNKALTLRVKTLNNNIKEKDNEISFLKSKINSLRNTVEYWKDKFDKLISFLYSKLHNWYDKDDKYIGVVNDMYEDKELSEEDRDLIIKMIEENEDLKIVVDTCIEKGVL